MKKSGFLVCCIFLFFLSSVSARDISDGKKVRIGWYEAKNFQEKTGDSAIKNGYSYEYLQKIANYTGWEYEYVYENWAELFEKLENSEIDLLAGVSFTPERSEKMLFPRRLMGYESYYIYKHINDSSIDGNDLSSFTGKKIGTIRNNLLSTTFETWVSENEVQCQEVLFDSFEERDEAFERGEIDGIVSISTNVSSNSGFAPVIKVDESVYFLAVCKERSDLLKDLDEAQYIISESTPYFINQLQIKYYMNSAVSVTLTEKEEEWIETHKVLRVGYVDDYLPFCDATGRDVTVGVITETFEMWRNALGLEDRLSIDYVPYPTYEELLEALHGGKVDAAFPIIDSIWFSEQDGLVQTGCVLESSVYIIYKNKYLDSLTPKKIAISGHSAFQKTYSSIYYPESELVVFDSAEECLNAVMKGKASCTIFNSGHADAYLSRKEYSELKKFTLGKTVNYCIGVTKGNTVIYSLLERGVSILDKSKITNALYKYVYMDNSYTIEDFVRKHMFVVLVILASFIVVILIALFVYINANRKENIQKKELKKALALAEQANRAKTAFLFNMSHDIRTPMNAIMGYTDLLEKSGDNIAKRKDYVKKIKISNNYLLSLINSVLEMARIESGATPIKEEQWGVEAFNDTLFSVFDQEMKKKNITFTRTIDVQHKQVLCDSTMLRQVFLNILSNAVKYTPEGGHVTMCLRELPSAETGIAYFETVIEDDGIGMSKEFLSMIFEEFTREKNSTESRIEGTGLGMAITKKLVDLMNGSISVESERGKGTKFKVIIPHKIVNKLCDDDKEEVVCKENDKVLFSGKRVLLVEDNELSQEIAVEILKGFGLSVEVANNGQEAVDMICNAPADYFNLVLMDIQMPVMNGYSATVAIRNLEDKKKADITIYAMTANAFDEDKENAKKAGMNGHIAKPIDVEKLKKILQGIL